MKTMPDGAVCFYKSKTGAVIFVVFGVFSGFFAYTAGPKLTANFLVPAGLSAGLLALGIYLLFFYKKPYVTISGEALQVAGLPVIPNENIKLLTLETFTETSRDNKGAQHTKLIEYMAIYVNDMEKFNVRNLSIGYNKPATPFYITMNSFSRKEAGLLKDAVKTLYGERADLRHSIHRAADTINSVLDAVKTASQRAKDEQNAGTNNPEQK